MNAQDKPDRPSENAGDAAAKRVGILTTDADLVVKSWDATLEEMTEALAPVCLTASLTVSNTGHPSCVVPPFPGVTPPTTVVPYAAACLA